MSIVDGKQLISATELHAIRDATNLRVFDCTVHLVPDPPRPYRIVSGHADWLQTRLPKAGFLDPTATLSDTSADTAFTMPAAAAAARAFGEAGVVDGAHLVLYASNHPMWATRVWWMLHTLGVEATVLDGGLSAWTAAGLATDSGSFAHAAGTLSVAPRADAWADRDQVLASIGDGDVCTLNALSPAMYRGDGDRHYGRPGHIRGSRNLPYASMFADDQQRFADAASLRAHFATVDALDRRVICYCGGGISATCDAFALRALGHHQVAVYDGSMSEWVKDAELPLTVGETP